MVIHYSEYKELFNKYPADITKNKKWPNVNIPAKLH